MAVLTITGQVGAGDRYLGEKIGRALEYKIVDRKVMEEVLKNYGIVEFEELFDSPPGIMARFNRQRQEAIDLLNKIYLSFAKKDNIVLISRRAFVALEPFVNVLNVLLTAPLSFRARKLAEWDGLDEQHALRVVDEIEQVRTRSIEVFSKRKWDLVHPYTLVINTYKIGFEIAEKWIIEAIQHLSHSVQQTGWQDGFPTIETIETDPVLENIINQLLAHG
jgi:cytidylate kinase